MLRQVATNELLRDYFPKGTDLSTHSTQHLLAVENELNNRPRLVLNDRALAEPFGQATAPAVVESLGRLLARPMGAQIGMPLKCRRAPTSPSEHPRRCNWTLAECTSS